MSIYDPEQKTNYLTDFMVFFKPGDIVKWKPIDKTQYEHILEEVEKRTYTPRMKEVVFSLNEFDNDIEGTNAKLEEVLYAN